jgi:gamma-glutamyltranspeptidase/glutathione hydrolase
MAYTVPSQPEGSRSGCATTEKPGLGHRKVCRGRAANPLATDAGYQVLKAGGSAVDAAIAVQMVLTLVEPQSSGIGGGAFLLHCNGCAWKPIDGRETAPAAADRKAVPRRRRQAPALQRCRGRRPLGGRAGHGAHAGDGARAARQAGLGAAVRARHPLAEGGFKVSARLNTLLANEKYLAKDPVAAAYFYDPPASPGPWAMC